MKAKFRCPTCSHEWEVEKPKPIFDPDVCKECGSLYTEWVNHKEWRQQQKDRRVRDG